jgi:hypothetical protein
MTSIEIAQRLFDGDWMHAVTAREACQRGTWAEFVRGVVPRRPLLFGRFAHARCLAEEFAQAFVIGSGRLAPELGSESMNARLFVRKRRFTEQERRRSSGEQVEKRRGKGHG